MFRRRYLFLQIFVNKVIDTTRPKILPCCISFLFRGGSQIVAHSGRMTVPANLLELFGLHFRSILELPRTASINSAFALLAVPRSHRLARIPHRGHPELFIRLGSWVLVLACIKIQILRFFN